MMYASFGVWYINKQARYWRAISVCVRIHAVGIVVGMILSIEVNKSYYK